MTNEPSPRPWRVDSDNLTLRPPVCFVVDANGAKVSGGFFSHADAALIVDAVNFYDATVDTQLTSLMDERDRLRAALERIAGYEDGIVGCIESGHASGIDWDGITFAMIQEAREALGEDKE